jgi:monomeric sarcosine oxidase
MIFLIFLTTSVFSAILRNVEEKRGGTSIVRQQRIVIVGAGIVGLSTAYALLSQGNRQVTVLEQEAVDHRRSTSHGISRLLRFEYGDDAFYSEMVRLSLRRWKALEQRGKRRIYTRTGVLALGREDDDYTRPAYCIGRKMGLPTQHLSRQQCQQIFPQFATEDYDMVTYNREAGILHASTCLQTLKELVIELGGTVYEGCRINRIIHDDYLRPVRLLSQSGAELAADRLVLATGPWVHKLLRELRLPVRLTRQYLLYFSGLPYSSFSVGTFPAFISSDLYGFPMHSTDNGQGPCWLKAASHSFGTPVNPDEISPLEERVIARIACKLRELLPALQQAELAHIDSCIYDVTPDEDFILDHLPYDPRIVFATGLSGHGFKFGILLGELLSSMVCETPPDIPLERFRLTRFTTHERQAQLANAGISSVA